MWPQDPASVSGCGEAGPAVVGADRGPAGGGLGGLSLPGVRVVACGARRAGLIAVADGYPPSVLGRGGTMRGVSLPSAHEGERVVEPHLVDGDAVDLRSGRLFRRVGTVHAVRLDAPFHVMENGHRKVGNAGDWLLEDEFGQRHVVDPESFEMLFEEA